MPGEPPELRRLQVRFHAQLTGGVEPGTGGLSASGRLAPADALAVYRTNYARGMVSAMATMHPALRHALGEPLFSAAVLGHLRRRPPRGHSLTGLDDHLDEYLSREWPARGTAGIPLDFLVDLARLERAVHQVYDGPGTEEGGALISMAGVEAGSQLWPAPCLRLLACRFPVGAYLVAVRRGEPAVPAPADTFLALCRRAFAITITDLGANGFAALQAIVGGAPVPAEALPSVERWVEAGFFADNRLRVQVAGVDSCGRCPQGRRSAMGEGGKCSPKK